MTCKNLLSMAYLVLLLHAIQHFTETKANDPDAKRVCYQNPISIRRSRISELQVTQEAGKELRPLLYFEVLFSEFFRKWQRWRDGFSLSFWRTTASSNAQKCTKNKEFTLEDYLFLLSVEAKLIRYNIYIHFRFLKKLASINVFCTVTLCLLNNGFVFNHRIRA